MSFATALGLWLAGCVAVCALARNSAGARLAVGLAALLLAVPWLVQAHYGARIAIAFLMALLAMAAIDYAAGRRPPAFSARLRHLLFLTAFIDWTTRVAVAPHFDRVAGRALIVAVAAGAMAAAVWIFVSSFAAPVRVPLRLAAASAFILAAAELQQAIVRMVCSAFGSRFAAMHVQPYRSRTVTEFWSRRWNRVGARWLRDHAFLPFRTRGVIAALFVLFGTSAAMHAYLIAAAAPVQVTSLWAAFFAVQPTVILAERKLRARTWRPVAARIWTFAAFTALLPLFLAPMLVAFDLSL